MSSLWAYNSGILGLPATYIVALWFRHRFRHAVIDFAKSTDRLRSKKDEDEGGAVGEERMEMENRAAGKR